MFQQMMEFEMVVLCSFFNIWITQMSIIESLFGLFVFLIFAYWFTKWSVLLLTIVEKVIQFWNGLKQFTEKKK
jgi:hypothetical protein